MAGGPLARGRPDTDTARWRYRMSQLFKHVVTDEDVIEVIEHVQDMAKTSDDIQWTTLYLAYVMGKPTSSDPATAGIQVDGDLNIAVSQLSRDQLRALASIDASYTTLEPLPEPPPAPSGD